MLEFYHCFSLIFLCSLLPEVTDIASDASSGLVMKLKLPSDVDLVGG